MMTMKKTLCLLAMIASLNSFGQDTNAINAGFQLLVRQVHTKIAAGKTNETDLKPELAQFDRLIHQENGAKTEQAAHIAYMRATLFIEILGQVEKGRQMLAQITHDYPNTSTAGQAQEAATAIAQDQASKRIRDALEVGAPVPDFSEKDMDEKPISLAGFKGKVVLIQFWAMWCVNFYDQLPELIEIYKRYHRQGFEIIGVSLDSDRQKLEEFVKQHAGMTWHEYFDGRMLNTKLATKFGVDTIPSSLLIGPDGKLIGKSLQGDALERAVASALRPK
jgi:peroxiredoxin